MSPLRIVISAYASSRRSIAANRRPNGVLEGANGMEAVLDIDFPFLEGGQSPPHDLGKDYVYQMPVTTGLFA